jgi:hypothetical protein
MFVMEKCSTTLCLGFEGGNLELLVEQCEKQRLIADRVSAITNADHKKNKRPCCLPNREMRKGSGPSTFGFGVRGLQTPNAKTKQNNNRRIIDFW